MKLFCLSKHTTKTCNVFKFKNTTIMLDCGLDMSTALLFLPIPLVKSAKFSNLPTYVSRNSNDAHIENELYETGGRVFIDSSPEFCPPETNLIDFSEIDIILISNYQTMLALPYITEETNFNGIVYATEPTLQIGRQFMKEIITYIENTPKLKLAKKWKQPDILKGLSPPLCDAYKPSTWKKIYSLKNVNDSLAKVMEVGYSQKIDIFGELEITAISSGYCLGSANWLIQTNHNKVVYISASSTLTTHPQPLETASLKDADALILTSLTQAPLVNPDSMLGDLCAKAASAIRAGGNVLIPCYPSGVVYDLFECLTSQLDVITQMIVPIYFLSPVADYSLAYANILAEWLSSSKQSKVYLPEEPFPHAQLLRNGRIKQYSGLGAENFSNDFKTPCVVFAGHCSLRFGDAVHFMELWGNSPNNIVIFTEPDFPYLDAIAPFQPLAMKVSYFPIDTSLSFSQANKLITDLSPKNLLVPEMYTKPNVPRTDLVIEAKCPILTFKRGDVVNVPVRRKYETVSMTHEYASSINPKEVKPGLFIKTLTSKCEVKDNKFIMKAVTSDLKRKSEEYPQKYVYGNLVVKDLIYNLHKAGITDVKIEQEMSATTIHLVNHDAIIKVADHSTHVLFTKEDYQLRNRVKQAIFDSLSGF